MPHGGLQTDMTNQRDLERHNEEVRLLYVGMTRAKQQLYLLHAQERALRGGMQRFGAKISPFLKSLPGCAPSWSNWFSPSNQTMQKPASGAAYSLRQMYTASAPSSKQPSETRQTTTSAHSKEDAPSVAPATPAQRRAARRRR